MPGLHRRWKRRSRDALVILHQPHIEISPPVSPELDVGADITFKVKVTCSSGCDLRGAPVTITTPEGVVRTNELADYTEKNNETGELTFQAPKRVGEYAWNFVFPRHETDHVIHNETSLPVSFRTIPHKTSLAVWDVPSPVAMNTWFDAKVGIRCAARCRLTGQLVEVRDETGNKMGEGKLGEIPWRGTDALYWTDAKVAAPVTAGVSFWVARFIGAELDLAHEEASAKFSFRSDRAPEHRVTIKVIGEDTRAPVGNAEVQLGFYVTVTDEGGVANFELPSGAHELKIWKDGYKGPPMTVEVRGDLTIQVEALKVLTEAEVEDAIRRFEASTWG
jgi:hypothetical protein